MASHPSPPGSPSRPHAPSDDTTISSTGSSSPPPPRSFLFRRRRHPRLPTPPPSPSKKLKTQHSPKPPRVIGPLTFSDFFQEEFTPVMRDLFNTLGVLLFVAKDCSHFGSYEILRSLEYITDQCADEVLSSTGDSQYILGPAIIEPTPPDRQNLHPDLEDPWDWIIGPYGQLEEVLKKGQVKLAQATYKVTEMHAEARDITVLRTFPQIGRKLRQAAHRFEVMYIVVKRQVELEIEVAEKDIADAIIDLAVS